MPEYRLDIAVYGIINAGKSSLINALARREIAAASPIGGTTTTTATSAWRAIEAEVGPYEVRLIDTPGLEEVGDLVREQIATEAAKKAELVVFVTAEDLTATALAAINALRDCGKPIIVALNKIDLLDPADREAVLTSVQARLADVIPPEDVIATAAAPVERQFVAGTKQAEVVRAEPQIAELEARLIEAIAASAPELRALNEAAQQVEAHLSQTQLDRAQRREQAERVADETSVGLALALAANPVPWLDFLAGSGGLAILVRRLAHVYGETPSTDAAKHLASELLRGSRRALWGSVVAIGLGGLLKFVPGVGHITGGLTQAVAAGYVAHVLGRVLVDYYENGHDWGTGGLHAALDRVAASTDRRELTRGLVARLRARLGDRH